MAAVATVNSDTNSADATTMTRDEKVTKLANAIREYRGRYETESGDWIRPPKVHALARVKKWLENLRMDVPESLKAIEGFKTFPDFEAWLKELESQRRA